MRHEIEETFSKHPSFRVRVQGAPPPRGWFVKYVSGMEDKPGIKPGFWLAKYYIDSNQYLNFNFEPELDLHWETEAEANEVSKVLREHAGVETTVVKVGT